MIIFSIGERYEKCTLCVPEEHGHLVRRYATHFKGLIGVGSSVHEAIKNNPIWKELHTTE